MSKTVIVILTYHGQKTIDLIFPTVVSTQYCDIMKFFRQAGFNSDLIQCKILLTKLEIFIPPGFVPCDLAELITKVITDFKFQQ
jgi:hypothetical protein